MRPTVRQLQLHVKIARGLLPAGPSPVVSAESGHGASCAGCDETIAGSEIGYELSQSRRDGTPYRFHIACYKVWESVQRALAERVRRDPLNTVVASPKRETTS
jgi:hypothetical protein